MNREGFKLALMAAAASHPAGPAVEIKEDSFYLNPKTELFISENGEAGAAVSEDGELVSVFKKYKSNESIGPILEQAAAKANHLSCFTGCGAYLIKLYEKHGFKVKERFPFNPDYAPSNWNYERLGTPDVCIMTK